MSIVNKLIRGNFEVKRSRTLANTSRCIVVRTVAGAEEATREVTSTGYWYTTQVGANTEQNQVVWVAIE